MKVKYLDHYNSAPFCACNTVSSLIWRCPILKMKKVTCFQALRAWSTLFSVPCYKWLLRVELKGEAGLMNGFCLPMYCFLVFFHGSQFDCNLLKEKVECRGAEKSTDSLQSGSVTPIFITYLLVEFWLPPNVQACGFFILHWELVLLLRRPWGLLCGPWSHSTSVQYMAPLVSYLATGRLFNSSAQFSHL